MLPPSLTRNQVKHVRGLRARKYRYQQSQFVAEGETIVAEILAAPPSNLRYVVCTPEYYTRNADRLQSLTFAKLFCCNVDTFRRMSSLDTPPAALAVLDIPVTGLPPRPASLTDPSATTPLTGLNLYLDGIRDPGNLGTILRVADWFGHATIFLSDDCVDAYNSKTIQASMGAFLRVPIQTASLHQLCSGSSRPVIVGTCIADGNDGLSYHWPADTLLVIGSESHGIRPLQRPLIDTWLSIPRGGDTSGAESLNAAVASGILCAAYLASRRQAKP